MYYQARNVPEGGLLLPFVFAITLSIATPLFLIIGLIVNILKNKNQKSKLINDNIFWIWLILLILLIILYLSKLF